MASSMSLASGVLLFSSLAVLLPQSQKRLNNDTLLYTCFFAGAAFTSILTRLIHYLMPNAIHACGDSSEACDEDQERQRLGKHRYDVEYGTMKSSESHFRFHHEDQQQQQNGENSLNEPSTHDHHHHSHHHHESMEEVVANDPKHYFSIGIQTAIAICVHKFPGKIKSAEKRERKRVLININRGTCDAYFNKSFSFSWFKCLHCNVST